MLVAVLQQEKCVLYLFLIPFVLYKDRNKSDNNDANAAEGGDVGHVRLYIRTYAFILLNRLRQQVDGSSFAACSGTQDQRGRLRTAQGTSVPT